jgi:hypothetical protein
MTLELSSEKRHFHLPRGLDRSSIVLALEEGTWDIVKMNKNKDKNKKGKGNNQDQGGGGKKE